LVSFGVGLKPGRKLALCRFEGFSRIIGGGRAFDRPTRQDAAGVDGGGRCEGLCGRLDAPITPTDRLAPFLRLLEIEGEFVERVRHDGEGACGRDRKRGAAAGFRADVPGESGVSVTCYSCRG
jgi:hypothetical protein